MALLELNTKAQRNTSEVIGFIDRVHRSLKSIGRGRDFDRVNSNLIKNWLSSGTPTASPTLQKDLVPAKKVVFVKPDRQIVSLRLDRKVVDAVKILAAKKGIGYSSLLRMWLIEDIRQELT